VLESEVVMQQWESRRPSRRRFYAFEFTGDVQALQDSIGDYGYIVRPGREPGSAALRDDEDEWEQSVDVPKGEYVVVDLFNHQLWIRPPDAFWREFRQIDAIPNSLPMQTFDTSSKIR
jgi:hypothetical protein